MLRRIISDNHAGSIFKCIFRISLGVVMVEHEYHLSRQELNQVMVALREEGIELRQVHRRGGYYGSPLDDLVAYDSNGRRIGVVGTVTTSSAASGTPGMYVRPRGETPVHISMDSANFSAFPQVSGAIESATGRGPIRIEENATNDSRVAVAGNAQIRSSGQTLVPSAVPIIPNEPRSLGAMLPRSFVPAEYGRYSVRSGNRGLGALRNQLETEGFTVSAVPSGSAMEIRDSAGDTVGYIAPGAGRGGMNLILLDNIHCSQDSYIRATRIIEGMGLRNTEDLGPTIGDLSRLNPGESQVVMNASELARFSAQLPPSYRIEEGEAYRQGNLTTFNIVRDDGNRSVVVGRAVTFYGRTNATPVTVVNFSQADDPSIAGMFRDAGVPDFRSRSFDPALSPVSENATEVAMRGRNYDQFRQYLARNGYTITEEKQDVYFNGNVEREETQRYVIRGPGNTEVGRMEVEHSDINPARVVSARVMTNNDDVLGLLARAGVRPPVRDMSGGTDLRAASR